MDGKARDSGGRVFWTDGAVWRRAAYNTMWCLIGCAIGDFGTIAWFQFYAPGHPVWLVMGLAMMNGLLTSIALETVILRRGGMGWRIAARTACGMSLISMLGMEAAMNATDFALTGGAVLTWWVIPPALLAGYLTPLPYNYWRLKKFGAGCCGGD